MLNRPIYIAAIIVSQLIAVGATSDDLSNSASPPAWTQGEKSLQNETIAVPQPLRMTAGTISFWIKPEWGLSGDRSHALLSARWEGSTSYLAISQGWGEPLYGDRLHFIVSSDQEMGCSARYQLPVGAWLLITAVWQGGRDGYCKLFVDDQLIASHFANFSATDAQIGAIQLGTDSATTDRRGRTGPGRYGPILTLGRTMAESDVIRKYHLEEWQSKDVVAYKKWLWTNDTEPPRNKTVPTDGNAIQNIRAIFDEDGSWARSPATIDARLTTIKAAGFNAYFPCVWHSQGTRFKSSLAMPEIQLAVSMSNGWDPLAYLINRAHSMGIEIHPWFTVALREGAAYTQYWDTGTPKGAFDVHNENFRLFIENLILDVIRRYDVDGINLDYIRSMGICTSDSCFRDYQNKTGADLLADFKDSDSSSSARRRLRDWLDRDVGSIVWEVASKARQIRPALIVSVDSYAEPDQESRLLEGRDDIGWANKNWIDAIFHMDYRAVLEVKQIDAARASLVKPSKLIVLVGNYDRVDGIAIPRTADWIAHVSNFVLNRWGGNGLGVYQLEWMVDPQVAAFGNGPFRIHGPPRWSKGSSRIVPAR